MIKMATYIVHSISDSNIHLCISVKGTFLNYTASGKGICRSAGSYAYDANCPYFIERMWQVFSFLLV